MLPLKTILKSPGVKRKLLIGAAVVAAIVVVTSMSKKQDEKPLQGVDTEKKKKSATVEL